MEKDMKTFINWIIYSWRSVMDSRYNPLRHILDPSIQAYFTLALFIMWSAYFAIVAWTYIGWESYSIVWSIWIHMGVVIPIMITNQVFRYGRINFPNTLVIRFKIDCHFDLLLLVN